MGQEDVSALARALFGVPQGGVVHERTLAPPLPKPLPPLPRPDMLRVCWNDVVESRWVVMVVEKGSQFQGITQNGDDWRD